MSFAVRWSSAEHLHRAFNWTAHDEEWHAPIMQASIGEMQGLTAQRKGRHTFHVQGLLQRLVPAWLSARLEL